MTLKPDNTTTTGVILDEFVEITIDDLCRSCQVDQTMIISLVDEGIVEPHSVSESPWRFSGTALPIVKRALRLQIDLELNPAGVAFALDLLEEIEKLRHQIRLLENTADNKSQ